jgi:hypothetical protein
MPKRGQAVRRHHPQAAGTPDAASYALVFCTPGSAGVKKIPAAGLIEVARAVWLVDQTASTSPILTKALAADDQVLRRLAADCLGARGF